MISFLCLIPEVRFLRFKILELQNRVTNRVMLNNVTLGVTNSTPFKETFLLSY